MAGIDVHSVRKEWSALWRSTSAVLCGSHMHSAEVTESVPLLQLLLSHVFTLYAAVQARGKRWTRLSWSPLASMFVVT